MSRYITHDPNENWGGSRDSAGRHKDGKFTKLLAVRVCPEVYKQCREKGGAAFVRAAIDKALLQRRRAANKPLSPEPGLDSLREEDFAVPVEEKDRTIQTPTLMSAQCGFPSPALDYTAEEISIYDLVVKHEDATIIVRAAGDSMIDAGIFEGDILVIDRAVRPHPGDIVLAYLHGDFTVKRYRLVDDVPELHPENAAANYPIIRPTPYDDFCIEGVLITSIRKFRK